MISELKLKAKYAFEQIEPNLLSRGVPLELISNRYLANAVKEIKSTWTFDFILENFKPVIGSPILFCHATYHQPTNLPTYQST